MSSLVDTKYIEKLINRHAKYSFNGDGQKLLRDLPIIVCSLGEFLDDVEGLFVFKGLKFNLSEDFKTNDCFGVSFPCPCPVIDQLPSSWARSEDFPWLLVKGERQYALDFDLWGAVVQFLVKFDQKPEDIFDEHGRQDYRSNSLVSIGLHLTPILNIAFFAILAVAKGWQKSKLAENPAHHVLPPMVVLSHDCDQLRGNDFYTQSIRLLRFFKDIVSFKIRSIIHLKFFFLNIMSPSKYYFYDALFMRNLEKKFGFRSVFYFLNGRGGRYGARSGSSLIKPFCDKLDSTSDIGIHYNYMHSQDKNLLMDQISELSLLTGKASEYGRAHYLTFDAPTSFSNIKRLGVRLDESVGYSSKNAFRLGFSGAFEIEVRAKGMPLYELPLLLMDANIISDLGQKEMLDMCSKIELVGGIVTFLFHPGLANNPEFSEFLGVYERSLTYFSNKQYRCILPSELVEMLDETN